MKQNKIALHWITGEDTGNSSKTLWGIMMDIKVERSAIPYDPSDFGRCYRLLELIPAWRKRLGEMSLAYTDWQPFVKVWSELEKLWEEESPSGTCPKLYKRMQELRNN